MKTLIRVSETPLLRLSRPRKILSMNAKIANLSHGKLIRVLIRVLNQRREVIDLEMMEMDT